MGTEVLFVYVPPFLHNKKHFKKKKCTMTQ